MNEEVKIISVILTLYGYFSWFFHLKLRNLTIVYMNIEDHNNIILIINILLYINKQLYSVISKEKNNTSCPKQIITSVLKFKYDIGTYLICNKSDYRNKHKLNN